MNVSTTTDVLGMHLDIAGSAFRKTADSYRPRGTGFGVRPLVDYLRNTVLTRELA